VEWQAGASDEDSFAFSIAGPDHWDLADCVAIVSAAHKKTGSTEGHAIAHTSPLQAARVVDSPRRLEICRKAILERDFNSFASIVELDSDMMHAVMMTSTPALSAFRELGDQYFQSVCLYEIGSVRAKQGEWEEGIAELRESLRLSRELGSRFEIAGGLLRLAETEQHLGQSASAVRLYCAARNVYKSIDPLQPEDDLLFVEYLTSCRSALGETEFEAALEEGRAMTMEQAVAYALQNDR
jgi:tetratricopeptide (TPR) repeat protein